MSISKRRLSSNSGLLRMCEEENSDDEDLASVGLQEKSIYTFPKKNNARRRSSFGGMNSSKSPVNAQEQARITEMYKTVIQMSSENVSTHTWQSMLSMTLTLCIYAETQREKLLEL